MGYVRSQIRPGATVRHRGETEDPGDEDITLRHYGWGQEEEHHFEINRPRAVSDFSSGGRDVGREFATQRRAPRLRSWADNEFFHHTSEAGAKDIMGRLHRGEPGLLLSRSGDIGPGIYTSADKTAWAGTGSRREHPGFEFALGLHGHRSIGAGPGGAGMYDPDPPKIVARRFHKIGHEGRGQLGGSGRQSVDPNFWREHGYDTVVAGGKETTVTHPLQVQVLRARDKATGHVTEFNDEVHRHYKPELRVRESDYSPRQERN
jgi:hypothetical protein